MKYKQLLESNMVPEWRNQYLDYHGLDAALNKAIESKNMKARQKGVDLYFELIKFNQKFADYFSRESQYQLDKINAFHREKLTEMKGKFNNLHDQLDQVLSSASYKEIQPNKVARYSQFYSQYPDSNQNESNNYSTVTSISELFKSIKHRMSTTSSSCQHEGCMNRNSLTESHRQPERCLSVANLFTRPNRPNHLVHNGNAILGPNGSRCEPSHINLNLRLGREKMTLMRRKLSESFVNSKRRLSSNFASLNNTFSYNHPSGGPPISGHHSGRLGMFSSIVRKLSSADQFADNESDNTGNAKSMLTSHLARRRRMAVDADLQQNFQTLSSTTPQSKRKIVASYKKKLSNLKFAFRELYFNLVLFEQYTQLNHSGFQQILRKHDRMFASSLGRKFYEEHVQTADFYNDLQEIDHLIENVEHIYTLHFENGNRRRAIEKLQVPTDVYEQSSPRLDFRVGYEFGMFTILFILVILVGLISETGYDWRTVFRLYRSPLMLIIFLFQTGISIVIWKHYKINHVLIFELNPRDNLSFHHFIEFGSQLGIIWSISVLLFLFSERFDVKPSILPLIVVLIIVMYLFNPTQTCSHQARFWLLKKLGRIFTAPFSGRVRFADFWIADQLVSIVPLFLDLEYLFCFYTTGDVLSRSHLTPDFANRCVTRNPQDLIIRTIVAALPAWFRCAQCLRRWRDENWLTLHLANAGKYWCMVMVVVLSSVSQYNKTSFEVDTMRIVWMVAAIFTSSLTAYWDIIYDFGLFHKYDKNEDEEKGRIDDDDDNSSDHTDKFKRETRTPSNSTTSTFDYEEFQMDSKRKKNKRYPFLRKELVYPVWVYYFAIVENVILRFGWIITISLMEFSGIEAGLVVSLLAPMEMFRRFVWNCIRLENEQLNNCGLFRAVRDIPMEVVAPIDESHLDKVIMMMDSRDGPSMRNRLMKRRTLRPDRVSFMILQRPGTSDAMTRRYNRRS